MHGSGLDGPILSSISTLTSLTDMRISELEHPQGRCLMQVLSVGPTKNPKNSCL
ncbi:hypothetical protein YC2023_056883 [Brassica napus]